MRSISAFLAFVIAAATLLAGCGGVSSTGATGGTGTSANAGAKLTLVAYSTPKEAYEEIIPAFQKTPEGGGVTFDQSYGASGEQSRAVEAGLPRDVVAFSLEPDVTRLVDAGLVADDWNSRPVQGHGHRLRRRSSSSGRETRRGSRPGTTSSSLASR